MTDPASGLTKYAYDGLDQPISVTDPRNKVTSYTYSGLGDLTQQVSPDTGNLYVANQNPNNRQCFRKPDAASEVMSPGAIPIQPFAN